MALAEMIGQVGAGPANIGKDAYPYTAIADYETEWINGIVLFWKWDHGDTAHFHGHMRLEIYDLLHWQPKRTLRHGRPTDINGKPVLPGYLREPGDMIGMLVRNKNRLYLLHGEPKCSHPPLCFAAGNAGINKHGLPLIAHIVAIAVTSRIQSCSIKGHGEQRNRICPEKKRPAS